MLAPLWTVFISYWSGASCRAGSYRLQFKLAQRDWNLFLSRYGKILLKGTTLSNTLKTQENRWLVCSSWVNFFLANVRNKCVCSYKHTWTQAQEARPSDHIQLFHMSSELKSRGFFPSLKAASRFGCSVEMKILFLLNKHAFKLDLISLSSGLLETCLNLLHISARWQAQEW